LTTSRCEYPPGWIFIAEADTVHTLFVKGDRKTHDDVALFEIGDARTEIKNFATEFVTHDGVDVWLKHDGAEGTRWLIC